MLFPMVSTSSRIFDAFSVTGDRCVGLGANAEAAAKKRADECHHFVLSKSEFVPGHPKSIHCNDAFVNVKNIRVPGPKFEKRT
mmetsp:Transcript_13027/g.30718  ORF Transcript_13027/g.30718 Transcript_13027/m.30718 type:complete len:83 (+) Transcript_13027:2315-2563(+)